MSFTLPPVADRHATVDNAHLRTGPARDSPSYPEDSPEGIILREVVRIDSKLSFGLVQLTTSTVYRPRSANQAPTAPYVSPCGPPPPSLIASFPFPACLIETVLTMTYSEWRRVRSPSCHC